MRDVIRFGLILMIVCVISAAALSYTYQSTAPLIEESKREELKKALMVVLPTAQEFKTTEGTEIKGDEEIVIGYSDGQEVGMVFKVSTSGYGGPIELVVGVDMEGKVSGCEILSQSETPGLGARIVDPKENFLEQFKGKTINDHFKAKDDIDAISGATISSQAVANGVKTALKLFEGEFERESLIIVLPTAQEFMKLEREKFKGDEEVIIGYSDGQKVGAVFKLSVPGYGGPIELMVGVNMKGEVSGCEILSQSETPGLGARIADPEEKFLEQFKGKTLEFGDDIDVISGATISSQAVAEGVKKALELFPEYLEGGEK